MLPENLTYRLSCYARITMLLLLSVVFILSASGCGGSSGNCSVLDNGDGTSTISCPDGSSVVISNGQDGSSSLIVNELLQDGDPNCPNGGIAVHTGVDSDGNGLLEGDEIVSTSYLCNGQDGEVTIPTGILQGSYTIRNSLDADWIASITSITGDLVVDAPGLTSLDLPALTSVGGNLSIYGNDALTSLDLTALMSVGGDLYIGSNSLTSLDLTALTSVGGLNIENNVALTSLDLTALTSVEGDLNISGNYALTNLAMPALTSVEGYLYINNNTSLSSLSLTALTSVGGDLNISSNAALTSLGTCQRLWDTRRTHLV